MPRGMTLVASPLIDIAMDCNMQTQLFEKSIQHVLLQTNSTSGYRTNTAMGGTTSGKSLDWRLPGNLMSRHHDCKRSQERLI